MKPSSPASRSAKKSRQPTKSVQHSDVAVESMELASRVSNLELSVNAFSEEILAKLDGIEAMLKLSAVEIAMDLKGDEVAFFHKALAGMRAVSTLTEVVELDTEVSSVKANIVDLIENLRDASGCDAMEPEAENSPVKDKLDSFVSVCYSKELCVPWPRFCNDSLNLPPQVLVFDMAEHDDVTTDESTRDAVDAGLLDVEVVHSSVQSLSDADDCDADWDAPLPSSVPLPKLCHDFSSSDVKTCESDSINPLLAAAFDGLAHDDFTGLLVAFAKVMFPELRACNNELPVVPRSFEDGGGEDGRGADGAVSSHSEVTQ